MVISKVAIRVTRLGREFMKKLIFITIMLIFLGSCSSSTLLHAIEITGREKVNVFFQDDRDRIVIFTSKNRSGKEMVSLNTFTKTKKGYEYDAGGEFAVNFDPTIKNEFLTVSSVGHKTSKVFWGYVANYPNADHVNFILEGENHHVLYQSNVNIKKNIIVIKKLPNEKSLENIQEFRFEILDQKGKVIVKR